MCLYSKELDTVSHLLRCFLYSFLALVFVTSFLPIWLSDRCRCAFLVATCIKAKGRADFSPTLYATKVLQMMDLKGGWRVATLQSDGCLNIGRVGTWNIIYSSSDRSTPPLISMPAVPLSIFFFFLHVRFHFLNLFPTLNSLFTDWERHWGCNNKWCTKYGSHN